MKHVIVLIAQIFDLCLQSCYSFLVLLTPSEEMNVPLLHFGCTRLCILQLECRQSLCLGLFAQLDYLLGLGPDARHRLGYEAVALGYHVLSVTDLLGE